MPAAGGATRWLEIEGDPREHYIPRMDWAASSDEVILQRLNRLQNTNEVMLGDARTGQVRTVLTERDSTWVDVVDDLVWLKGGKEFTWVSERDGWKHVYAVSRDGKSVRLVTRGAFDVLEVKGIDDKGGWLYYVASPDNPAQKYLFRTRLDGKGTPQRISPRDRARHPRLRPRAQLQVRHRDLLQPGQPAGHPPGAAAREPGDPHPGGQRPAARPGGRPAPADRRMASSLPRGGRRRRCRASCSSRPTSTRPGSIRSCSSSTAGPGNTEVEDQWGGYYLWHSMLTQKGYLVAIVDNRGTPAPLGRAWRKAIYGQLGVLETQDQAAAATALRERPYVDRSRVGIWGWSYGAFMTLNVLFQHPDLYRMGVAVSPVTHWALYDNVYTERFNGLITTNRERLRSRLAHQLRERLQGRPARWCTGAATTTCTSRTASC